MVIFRLGYLIIFLNRNLRKKYKKYVVVNSILILVNGYSINCLPNHVSKLKLLIKIQ